MHRLAGESEAGQTLESKALRDIHHPWVIKSTAPLEVLALEVLFLQVHRKTRRKRGIQSKYHHCPRSLGSPAQLRVATVKDDKRRLQCHVTEDGNPNTIAALDSTEASDA